MIEILEKNVDTLNRLNISRGVHYWHTDFEDSFGLLFRETEIERIFSLNHCVYKIAEDFSTMEIFNDWFRQEFDLPVASLGVKRNVKL